MYFRDESSLWIDLYHKPRDTQRCLTFTFSQPNHWKQNIPFCFACSICPIAENNAKWRNFESLKSNLSKYHYLDSLTKQGSQKALSLKKHLYENFIKILKWKHKYLIQITLIFIALLNPRLIEWKIIMLATFTISA